MDDQTRAPSNLQVIAGAGAAAGVVSGIIVALSQRDEPPAPVVAEEAEPAVADHVERARRLGRLVAEAVPEATSRLDEGARTAAATARRRAAEATAAIDREAVDRLAKRAGQAADRGAKKGQSVKKQATRQARDVRKQASKQAHLVRKNAGKQARQARQVGDQTVSSAQAVAAQAAAAAVARAERARDRGMELAGTARERIPDVTQRVNEDLVPPLRDVALQAATAAIDLWQGTRDLASEAASGVDLEAQRRQLIAAARAGGQRARGATVALSGRTGQLGAGTKGLTQRGTNVRKSEKNGASSPSIARRAANATVDTTKDTAAVLAWGSAAGALVYYVLLTPERRDQVSKAAQTAATQVQELIRDFHGYDDEF
jgi:hypothetical protein